MTMKNRIMTTTLSAIVVFAIASVIGLNDAYAEGEYPYKVADNTHANFTFTFKDGVEHVDLPVFKMEDDLINKNVSPSFSVEGVIGNSPHLHKALDEAFKFKASSAYEFDYQLFDVDVDFIKNDTTVRTLNYHDCLVDNYRVKTLTDDYESYMSSKTGFAIIDDIDFLCGGLNSKVDIVNDSWRPTFTTTEYAHTPYDYAEDVRTFIIFEFDQGIEIIEFPYFQTNSGFEEETENVIPGFSVEGTVQEHPLLNRAIDLARSNSGIPNGVNLDFEATVEFKKGSEVLRTLEYKDCRVDGAKMTTQFDKEEGFTGKSGFAYVEEIDFECIGLDTINTSYEELHPEGTPIWRTSLIENTLSSHEYPLGTGPRAIATFTYDDGVETIDFPIFEQSSILAFVDTTGNNEASTFTSIPSSPTFELEGIVRDAPMLYNMVDKNLALSKSSGSNNFLAEFNVDVDLVQGEQVVRGFNYVDCRVIDYNVKTQRDKESSYFKGFALSNTFEFECKGYHPNVPTYDAMFNSYEKADTLTSGDLRETHSWEPGFFYEG